MRLTFAEYLAQNDAPHRVIVFVSERAETFDDARTLLASVLPDAPDFVRDDLYRAIDQFRAHGCKPLHS